MTDLYQEEIISAAKKKANYGELAGAHFQASQYNASCGDRILIQVRLDAKGSSIADLKWQGDGCIISQAVMSMLSEAAIGAEVDKILKYQSRDLLSLLHLENVSPGREKCLMIGLEALKKSLIQADFSKAKEA